MRVKVGQKSCSFVVRILVKIRAQSGFVYDKISDMLSVWDRRLRVIYFCLTFSIGCVESKLNFVNSIQKSEEGLNSAFNRANELLITIQSGFVVITCDRYKYVELSNEVKITHSNSDRSLVVKRNMVHDSFQMQAFYFIEDKCLLWVLKEVLLKRCVNLFFLKLFK